MKREGEFKAMKEVSSMSTEKITLLGISLAGIIAVASAGERYDLMDTAMGLVLLVLLHPIIKSKKKNFYELILVSTAAALSMVLIFGFLIDHFSFLSHFAIRSLCIIIGLPHFILWGIFIIVFFVVMKLTNNKLANQSNTADRCAPLAMN